MASKLEEMIAALDYLTVEELRILLQYINEKLAKRKATKQESSQLETSRDTADSEEPGKSQT